MTEVEALREEVAALRKEVVELRDARGPVVHNHYHTASQQMFTPKSPDPFRVTGYGSVGPQYGDGTGQTALQEYAPSAAHLAVGYANLAGDCGIDGQPSQTVSRA